MEKTGHEPVECNFYSGQITSEVNYAQNQGPFSQSYNSSWKNHPNLSYKNNQGGQMYQQNQGNRVPQNQWQGNQRNQSTGIEEIVKMQLELMNKMTSEGGVLKDSMHGLQTRMDNFITAQGSSQDRKSVV